MRHREHDHGGRFELGPRRQRNAVFVQRFLRARVRIMDLYVETVGFELGDDVDNPRVAVNPLSAFTPGMFRDIFRRPPPKLSQ